MALTITSCTHADPDPRVKDLPNWLRLQGATRPDMDPAEAEWCAMMQATARRIECLEALVGDRAGDPDPNSRLGLIIEWSEAHPTNANAIDMLWLAGLVRELSALTGELAGDLEAYVKGAYGTPVHPAEQQHYNRDMRVVRDARAAIARAGR